MALINNIIQIEEFTLAPGLTDIVYSSSGPIPNALIGIYCDKYGVYPADMKKEGNSIHVTYEAQSETINVALIFIMGGLSIVNHLTSTSETDALSAAQGKALKDLIDAMGSPALSDLTDVNLDSLTTDDILIYDGVSEKWINTPLPNIPSEIDDLQDVSITTPVNGQILKYNDGEWINSNESGGVINYSLTEQDTGVTWIDGKKIYQKTLKYTKTNIQGNINFSVTSDLPNIENVTKYESRIDYVILNQSTESSYYSDDLVRLAKTGSSYSISLTIGQATFSTADIYMTVWYTKTS